MSIKLSIITLTYKNFGHLKETILSVCNQTYDDIEYIICDDCSPDFPEEQIKQWLKTFAGANIKSYKILKQNQNVGTVKNLNYAYHQATGDYFINLSCGDVFFEKTTVSTLADRIKTNDSRAIITSRIMYEGNFTPVAIFPHYDEYALLNKMSDKETQYRSYIVNRLYKMGYGCVLCVSRDTIQKLGYFDESYFLLEDSPFFAKYLSEYKIDCWPELVSIWYETGGVSTEAKLHHRVTSALLNDVRQFAENIELNNLDGFSNFEKKYVMYRYECSKANGFLELCLAHIKHPILVLCGIKNRIIQKIHSKNDKKYIEKILGEREEPAVDYC